MSNPCSIRVGKDGKYCCDLKQLTVQHDGIGKVNFANLPATPIEYEVVCDEWIPAEPASIEGSGCITLLKPGAYRFLVDCAAIDGTEAPEEGVMGLCCENCKIEDYGQVLASLLTQLIESNSTATSDPAVLECLAELKLLTAANNDATALALLIAEVQSLCNKLLEGNATQVDVLTALQAVCDKLLENNEDNATLITSVTELCTKLENLINAQTGTTCDTPTFVELCGYTPIQCCKAPEEGLEVDAWCQAYAPVFPVGDGDPDRTYALSVDSVYYDLPNPYTQADVEAALALSTGDFQIIDGFICRTDQAGRVAFRCCYSPPCDAKLCVRSCSLAATVQQFVPAAEPTCHDAFPVRTCFEEPIAHNLETLVAQGEESLNCQAQIKETLEAVFTECEDACAESAVIGWCGRPATVADYAYGDIAEASLPEFNAAWEAAGGKTWIAAENGIDGGECHWFCPAIEGATFTINGVAPANGNVVVSPNPNAEALGCVAEPALSTKGCRDEAILAALQAMVEGQELANAKLCVIEQNSNPAAPCSKPVEGLDKEALTLTLAGDVTANYLEGQAIDLQNANAESCGSATSAGGAKYDAANDVTVIPIVECELDEGKEPVVITLAQPVKAVTLTAIKTIKTLTAVRTLVKTAEKV